MSTEMFRRRHLPHWDVPDATYFVTACLQGSIPAQGLLDIRKYEADLALRPRPENISEKDWALRRWKFGFGRAEHWLDENPAVRHLENPELAGVIVNSLLFFAGTRYDVLAYVVMPSHFHWVFCPLESWVKTLEPDPAKRSPRERIMHSVKRHTARECNRLLGALGAFWQQESYDHWVRDMDELERIIHYVEYNPVKAKLTSDAALWPFGSAKHRKDLGLPFGAPLPRHLSVGHLSGQVKNLTYRRVG
jgi:putative transposase